MVQPLRELGTIVADITGPMPYKAMFALTAEGAVKGHRHDVRSMYLASLDCDAAHTIVEALKMTSPAYMGSEDVPNIEVRPTWVDLGGNGEPRYLL